MFMQSYTHRIFKYDGYITNKKRLHLKEDVNALLNRGVIRHLRQAPCTGRKCQHGVNAVCVYIVANV